MDSGQFTVPDIRRKCLAVLGIRGSGKSNTAKVILQESVKSGIPVTVIDPDGEYVDLVLRLGGQVVDRFDGDGIREAVKDHRERETVVIDLSEWNEQGFKFLSDYLTGLWEFSRVAKQERTLVIEEAHEFVPQGKLDEIGRTLVRYALRGRKRGLGMLLVSQRSAKVNKDVLTQGEYYFLHRVIHPADLRVYKEILPLSPKEVESVFPSLPVGRAVSYVEGKVRLVDVPLVDQVMDGGENLGNPLTI